MTPFVSVIVPVRNGGSTLGDCLTSLLRSEFPAERREILVVDNGSTDRTVEVASAFPVRVVSEPRRGRSHARNRGIKEARAELIAFTDADCVVARRWLAELLIPFAEDGAAAAAGRTLAFPPRTAPERYEARRRAARSEWPAHHAVPYFQFENAAVRREVFERVGDFDPRFDGGAEDIDLAWRFFQAGYELSRVPNAIVLSRHRTSVRELFRRHVGYGHGQASLLRKHPNLISWGWRPEARAWADVAASVRDLAVTLARRRGVPWSSPEVQYPSLDLVRKLGQRLGFLRGLVDRSLGPGREA
jgi:GT2 family glycosyltransferase